MRSFVNELNKANKFNDVLNNFYIKYFNAIDIIKITDLNKQKAGIDKILITPENKIKIEEKVRYKDYGDMLLEIYSCLEYNTLGWAIDPNKETDILVYFISTTGTIYLIDYKKLRYTTIANLLNWSNYKDTKTCIGNTYYTTRNIAVNFNTLIKLGVDIKKFDISLKSKKK